ncbi:MAG: FkbM family methyltransferase [Bacteroidota bacterium]
MKENLLKNVAGVMRTLPSFRGKYRIGTTLQKKVLNNPPFHEPEFMVGMKAGFDILIDVRSESHLGAFWCGEYDTPLIRKFCRQFREGWTVLDIGANVGYYSIPMAQGLASLGGTLYAFEPLSQNFEALSRSVTHNQLSNLHLHKIGLGEKSEQLNIALTEGGETGNAVITNQALIDEKGFVPKESIQVESLDEIAPDLGLDRCDFIKVDIEGAEIFFLRGAKALITKHRPVIYGEFNSYFMRKFSLISKRLGTFSPRLDTKSTNKKKPTGEPSDSFR